MTHSKSAEIGRASALAVAFIGVGSLAFAFGPGTQVAPTTRPTVVVAKPTVVAMNTPITLPKPVEEAPSVLTPQLLASSSIDLNNPQRSTGELQPSAMTSATPVPAAATATVTAKSSVVIGAEEAERLYRRAEGLVADGDFAGARLLLERAVEAGHAGAIFMLASTYDPNVLGKVSALGIKGEPAKAKALYQQALAAGIPDSNGRLSALSATN